MGCGSFRRPGVRSSTGVQCAGITEGRHADTILTLPTIELSEQSQKKQGKDREFSRDSAREGRFSCGRGGAALAPGFRDAGNNGRLGALTGVGSSGYSWSSSFSGTSGVYLTFDVTYLLPGRADSRAYGFQLRCLSE